MFKGQLFTRSFALMLITAIALVALAPLTGDAQNGGARGGLAVPISVGDFTGTFTINRFDRQGNQVLAIGTVVGTRSGDPTVGVQQVAVPVTQIVSGAQSAGATAAAPAAAAPAQATGSCDILTLVLGPLHLDLLGLVVDLNQLNLQITGQTGSGNLLGNLVTSALNQITQLLNQILAAL